MGRIVLCCEGYQAEDVLRYAAAAEQKVMHPIAKAVCKKAEQLKLTVPEIDDSQYDVGHGITVNLQHETLYVGSLRFMEKQGLEIPESIQEEMSRINNQGHSFIMIAINHQIIGLLEIRSRIRSGVKDIVSNLRRRGVRKIAIVSGDQRYPTERLAESLGMDSCFYNVLPEDKAKIVEQLQNEGRTVCFVGDGINDAIAMKKAHVSISLRGATSVATDLAQVVLMDGTLAHLCDMFDLSKQLDVRQRQCLSFVGVSWATIVGCVVFLGWGMTPVFLTLPGIKLLGLAHAMLPLRQLPGDTLSEKYSALKTPENQDIDQI